MKVLKMFVYKQNNSYGIYENTLKSYDENLNIIPVTCEILEGKYYNIAVIDFYVVPQGVYFDGVENDIDCDCCGDRWRRLYEDSKQVDVYIFNTKEEYKKEKVNLNNVTYYFIKEDYLNEIKKINKEI